MTNEQGIRRIVREEIRAAFEAMYGELPWGSDTYEAAETVSRRFGRCPAKLNNGYDRCEHDAGACPEHDVPADPDAPVPFTVTTLAARFQDVPPVVPRRRTGAHCTVCGHATHGADSCPRCTCTGLLSAWSTSPITGDDVCTACPHTRSAHASAGCMDCACTTTRRAQ
jgi:hypothetical protein